MGAYIPRKGDFVALSFDPQTGHEQQGRRPALVVSKDKFNKHTGFCVVCPITRAEREFPFHVRIPLGGEVDGGVMVEQVKSVDYRARQVKRIGVAPELLLDEVLALLDACLY